MTIIRVSEAAREMGYCHRHTLRRLERIQGRHRDIEILIPREDPADKWRINLEGLRRAVKLERQQPEADLSHRVGMLEADGRQAQRKIKGLEARVNRIEQAESRLFPARGTGHK